MDIPPTDGVLRSSHPIVIYRDSITHRMLHLLHSYPTEKFTMGQLLAATQMPVPVDGAPPPRPPADVPTRATSRSCTTQITRMLAYGLAARSVRVLTATSSQYEYTAGPVGPGWWTLRAPAAWRPEDNPGLTD